MGGFYKEELYLDKLKVCLLSYINFSAGCISCLSARHSYFICSVFEGWRKLPILDKFSTKCNCLNDGVQVSDRAIVSMHMRINIFKIRTYHCHFSQVISSKCGKCEVDKSPRDAHIEADACGVHQAKAQLTPRIALIGKAFKLFPRVLHSHRESAPRQGWGSGYNLPRLQVPCFRSLGYQWKCAKGGV